MYIGIYVRGTLFLSGCIQFALSRQFFEHSSNIKFNQNPSSRSRFVPWGQTDGQTDVKKLIVAFRGFANASVRWKSGFSGWEFLFKGGT